MSTATRHAGAPYADGETLSGADLEADIANVYAVVNGDIDNTNIAASANIAGSKLADNSITAGKLQDGSVSNAKIADDTISNAKFTDGSTVRCYISTSSASYALGTATTFGTFTDVTAATVVATSVSDIILAAVTMSVDVTGAAGYVFGIRANGTDYPVLANVVNQDQLGQHYEYAFVAPTTSTAGFTVLPVWKAQSSFSSGSVLGTASANGGWRTFRVTVIPAKA